MNKKLLELLNQINAQKQKVIDLANAGSIEEATNNILQISFGLDWWENTQEPETGEKMEHLHTELTTKGDSNG